MPFDSVDKYRDEDYPQDVSFRDNPTSGSIFDDVQIMNDLIDEYFTFRAAACTTQSDCQCGQDHAHERTPDDYSDNNDS